MRKISLLWPAVMFALCSNTGWGQSPPDVFLSKPVTFVLPNVSGGTTDAEVRLYAQSLTENIGKPFLVDYKPGAGGILAGSTVAKAMPDGYTLLVATSSFTVTPAFSVGLPYDTIKDFAPVSLMTRRPTVLVAYPGFPANNLAEYIAYARANPDRILWGTSGVGGGPHLSGVWLHSEIRAPATFVHYNGSAQMYPDLLSGRIHVHPASLQTAMGHLRTGKTKRSGSVRLNRFPRFISGIRAGW